MTGRVFPLMILLPLVGAISAPADAVTRNASVNANVVKPLTLTSLQNLDLGTIILGPGTWSGATAGISRTGVFTCAAPLACTGAPQVARFKVTGSNKMVVLITAPDVTMVNQSDPSHTVKLVLDKPARVTLTSSGAIGTTFDIGGSLSLSSTVAGGTYTGTVRVTVDYQ